MVRDMPEPFQFPSLDSCQKTVLSAHKEAGLARSKLMLPFRPQTALYCVVLDNGSRPSYVVSSCSSGPTSPDETCLRLKLTLYRSLLIR